MSLVHRLDSILGLPEVSVTRGGTARCRSPNLRTYVGLEVLYDREGESDRRGGTRVRLVW